MHQFQSAEWRDRTALLVHPSTSFDSDVRRFQQARGNEPHPYGERHETIWAHKAPGTPGEMCRERNPTVSDECLVLVAPVSSDVLFWTADNSFYIHVLYLAHGQPRVQGKKYSNVPIPKPWRASQATLHPPSDGFLFFLNCVKPPVFPKTEFGSSIQVRGAIDLTKLSLMRAHRESVSRPSFPPSEGLKKKAPDGIMCGL